MKYLKGKDGKIKNIEQLDSVENRGISLYFRFNKPKAFSIILEDGRVQFEELDDNKPEGFEKW